MKRLATACALGVLALFAMSCTLTDVATPAPTSPPLPVLPSPVVGLNPVSGAPGTVIRVSAAGFPVGSLVNIYILINQPSLDTSVTATPSGSSAGPIMQGLTIGTGGFLTFDYQLPAQINGVNLTGAMPLNVLVSTTNVPPLQGSAIFIVTAGGATSTPTSLAGGGTGATGQLYIISPNIYAVISGGTVVVTGSGSAFNNRVGVQVLNAQNSILGSALATSQAGAGAVGPWQTTVVFPQPATAGGGFIVAYTVNTAGAVAGMTSIPITFTGAGAPTNTAPVLPTATSIVPTVPPVITAIPPTSNGGFITATPSSQ